MGDETIGFRGTPFDDNRATGELSIQNRHGISYLHRDSFLPEAKVFARARYRPYRAEQDGQKALQNLV